MTQKRLPPRNLPAESMPWGREIESAVKDLRAEVDRLRNGATLSGVSASAILTSNAANASAFTLRLVQGTVTSTTPLMVEVDNVSEVALNGTPSDYYVGQPIYVLTSTLGPFIVNLPDRPLPTDLARVEVFTILGDGAETEFFATLESVDILLSTGQIYDEDGALVDATITKPAADPLATPPIPTNSATITFPTAPALDVTYNVVFIGKSI